MLGQRRVVELVELQGHEQQPRADRGDPLLHALVEAADLGIVAMRREQQLREREHAADAILDRLVALDHAGEAVAVELGQAALVLGLQCRGVGVDRREIGLDRADRRRRR